MFFLHSAILEKSIGCLKLFWFLVFQQFEYFSATLPAGDSAVTVSHGLFSPILYSIVILGFILVGAVFLWYLLSQCSCWFEGIVLLFPLSWVSLSLLSPLLLVSSWDDEWFCGLKLVGQWVSFVFCWLGALMVVVLVSGVGRGEGGINWSWQGWTLI